MEKIFISGACGYIGSVLVPFLSACYPEKKIVCVDNLLYNQVNVAAGIAALHNVEFHNLDINRGEYLQLAKKADTLILLAAIVGMPACKKNENLAVATNLTSIARLCEVLSPNQRVIFPNSNSAYGKTPQGTVCDEKSPLNPLSVYAKTKQEAESHILFRENSLVFRLATAYGLSPRMRFDLLVNNFCQIASTSDTLKVFEGDFRRNFVHVKDIARACVFALDNWVDVRSCVYNLGDDANNMTKYQLADLICDINECLMVVDNSRKDEDARDYNISSKLFYSKGFRIHKELKTEIVRISKFCRQIMSYSLSGMSNV